MSPIETQVASQTARRRFLIPSQWKEKYAICHHRHTLAHTATNTATSPRQHPSKELRSITASILSTLISDQVSLNHHCKRTKQATDQKVALEVSMETHMKAQLRATTRHPYGPSGLKASAIVSAPTDRRRADAKQANDEQHSVHGTK